MAIGVQDIIDIAPEFSAEDPARIQTFINIAKKFINFKVWGEKADVGHAYFTAHLLKSSPGIGGGGGAQGPVTSEKVGDLQTTFASGGISASSYSSSSYGVIFEQLRKTLLITPIIST